jgi:hypothetical protein
VTSTVSQVPHSSDTGQDRLGPGQLLRFQHALLGRFQPVRPVLAIERALGDPAWHELCDSLGVALIWPPDFVGLADDPTRS